jgi:hypothetical protein
MEPSRPNDNRPADQGDTGQEPTAQGGELESLSAADASLEQRLRERGLSPAFDPTAGNADRRGPNRSRRDRLMYESGLAAALAQSQGERDAQQQAARRQLRTWQALTLGLSLATLFLVAGPRQPTPESTPPVAAVPETLPQASPPTFPPTRPRKNEGMRAAVAGSIAPSPSASNYLSLRLNWHRPEADWPTVPQPSGEASADRTEPHWRAADYRRLLDEG